MSRLIFEISRPGRRAFELPKPQFPQKTAEELFGADLVRKKDARLPEVTEVDVARHFTELSRNNFGVDSGFYPLGSCTMKYNPKINEKIASLDGFANLHPYQPEETVQGALKLMYGLSKQLKEITGMDHMCLQPSAGAQGEMAGLMIIKAYHKKRGDDARTKIICPDSAHGTNPASAAVAGFDVVQVRSNSRGLVDVDELRRLAGSDTAGLMLTNPNTLGLFEEDIIEISRIIHGCGGLLYYDGANANAILGKTRPGDMGFDVVHLNLHKTFTTPHGGGGPGAGPIGVKERLYPFVPVPVVTFKDGVYGLDYNRPDSIGKVRSFYGNFLVLARAYAYILSMGGPGLSLVSENAVLNANYMLASLVDDFDVPFGKRCMHEFVISGEKQKEMGVSTLSMAKRLLDYGYHPPTIYFPLIVREAMMIEPTETESKETLDEFIGTLKKINEEAISNPDMVNASPHTTKTGRLDEVKAARTPVLRYTFNE
ncbi:MAG: aminomethyl-transferring glycine dehydrogenase subunit GcvPB [Clostridia bacterium]|nr:aminomethyl-transferring glycine dehydrogenase subunit GcvPB [Clostridia bacterium]